MANLIENLMQKTLNSFLIHDCLEKEQPRNDQLPSELAGIVLPHIWEVSLKIQRN